MDEAHQALLNEIRRRLDAARDDRNVTNSDGSNSWGPYVTRAVNEREHDGPALVRYIKDVLRKSGESQGWNALLEAGRLDVSFEDMVLHAGEPIRRLFNDEDRQIAERSLGAQRGEIKRRRDADEAIEVQRDRRIVAAVAPSGRPTASRGPPRWRRACSRSAPRAGGRPVRHFAAAAPPRPR